jgi:hypothetical protein
VSAKIPVTEFARRICAASHRSDLAPGPSGGVPCAEHSQLAKTYYGLLDPKSKPMVAVIWQAIGEMPDGRE